MRLYHLTPSSYRQVGNRYIEKRINVRVEHVKLSRSREDFLKRVKENFAKQKKAKEEGVPQKMKRSPAMPRESRTVSMAENVPESITAIPYETTI
jgi:large subunit ribosomal protein L21e